MNMAFLIRTRKLWKDLRHIGSILFERMQGVDFTEFEEPDTGDRREIYPYERSSAKLLLPMLKRHHPGSSDAFLDIGCGKGYVLTLVKKNFHFARVAGIEISPSLCQTARRNLKKLGLSAEVFNAKAEDFDEYDNYNYFYMFNPCATTLIVRIAQRVADSLRRVPRTAYLLYSHPETTEPWEKFSESAEQIDGVIDGYSHRLVCFKLSPEKLAGGVSSQETCI